MTLTNRPREGRTYYDSLKSVEYIPDPVETTVDTIGELDTRSRKVAANSSQRIYKNSKYGDIIKGQDSYRYIHALYLPSARSAGQSMKLAIVSPEGVVGAVGDISLLFNYGNAYHWRILDKPIVVPSGWFLVVANTTPGYMYLGGTNDTSVSTSLAQFPGLTEGEVIDLAENTRRYRNVLGILRSTTLNLGSAVLFDSLSIPSDQIVDLRSLHIGISHSEASAVPVKIYVEDAEGNILSESPQIDLTRQVKAIQVKFSPTTFSAVIAGGVALFNLPPVNVSSPHQVRVIMRTTTEITSVPIPVAASITYSRTYRLQS